MKAVMEGDDMQRIGRTRRTDGWTNPQVRLNFNHMYIAVYCCVQHSVQGTVYTIHCIELLTRGGKIKKRVLLVELIDIDWLMVDAVWNQQHLVPYSTLHRPQPAVPHPCCSAASQRTNQLLPADRQLMSFTQTPSPREVHVCFSHREQEEEENMLLLLDQRPYTDPREPLHSLSQRCHLTENPELC